MAHMHTRRAGCAEAASSWLTKIVLCLAALSPLIAGSAHAFGLAQVEARAKELASQPYEPGAQVPESLRALSYDQWRDIRFKPENSLWRDKKLPFEIQFFHTGLFYDRPVAINLIRAGKSRPLQFSPGLFDYGRNGFEPPADAGFAGFRVHGPIKRADYFDEIAVFLGASYFRAVGAPHVYGLSARGVAVDTGAATGEEFPRFREFWLVEPGPQAKHITVFALLDGSSLTGAYKFVITPGQETIVDVESRLFTRDDIAKLGIAPLTSMFFYGENDSVRPVDDFRPEVHDSDGLLVAMASGERVWRPLANPGRLTINAFSAPNPRGFGLVQRDRAYDHYLDLEARYHQRPSAWIEPKGDWGDGHVELVQIPAANEMNDNIVAFWVRKQPVAAGERLAYDYRMRWTSAAPAQKGLARVSATRSASHDATGKPSEGRQFVLEFEGPRPETANGVAVEPFVELRGPAELVEQQLMENPETGGYRLVFRVRRQNAAGNPIGRLLDKEVPPVELRAFLRQGESRFTETWSYTLGER